MYIYREKLETVCANSIDSYRTRVQTEERLCNLVMVADPRARVYLQAGFPGFVMRFMCGGAALSGT